MPHHWNEPCNCPGAGVWQGGLPPIAEWIFADEPVIEEVVIEVDEAVIDEGEEDAGTD